MPDLGPVQLYLLAVNAVAFGVTWLCCRRDGVGSSVAPGLLAAAGGAVGSLAGLLVWGGRLRKANVATRVAAVYFLLAWVLVLTNVYWRPFSLAQLVASLHASHLPLVIYLAGVNLVTMVLFAVDKIRAKRGEWRVPEATLLILCLAGGAPAGMLTMAIARHKIRTWYFSWGVPAMLVLDAAIVAYLMQLGLV